VTKLKDFLTFYISKDSGYRIFDIAGNREQENLNRREKYSSSFFLLPSSFFLLPSDS